MASRNEHFFQLGDIIKINSPSNSQYHDNMYIIDFINNDIMKIKSQNGEEFILSLDKDKYLKDESIESIDLLSREETNSYAIQNELLPQQWITIHLGGDLPETINGEITNLEEDMIEITLYPSNSIIYIDFKYEGLPKELNIKSIIKRNKPDELERNGQKEVDITLEEPDKEDVEIKEDLDEEGKQQKEIDLRLEEEKEQRKQQREKIISASEIIFGSDVGEISQIIEVPDYQKRFSLQKQTDDLLNDLLSSIPNVERTNAKLKEIHQTIQRFVQLREMYSKFDANQNAIMMEKKGADYKPLVESLKVLDKKLYWILPIVENTKKIYNVESVLQKEIQNLEYLDTQEQVQAQYELTEQYLSKSSNYISFMKLLNPYYTPYNDTENSNTHLLETQTNILGMVSNLDNYDSFAINKRVLKPKRFLTQNYNVSLQETISHRKIEGGYYTTRRNYNKNDQLNIKSFITLPESVIHFSKISLPKANIMNRTNLNFNFLQYFKLLNKKTPFFVKSIQNFDNEINYEDNFANNIRTFEISPSAIHPQFNAEKYNDFLKTIVPRSRILFNLMKNHIHDKLSFYNVVEYLEPFLVYTWDVSFKLYEEITEFVDNKIGQYKANYVKNQKNFQEYEKTSVPRVGSSVLYEVLSNPLNEELFGNYQLDHMKQSNTTILKTMMKEDYMLSYMFGLANVNDDLFMPFNFYNLLEEQNEKIKMKLEKGKKDDSCEKYVLTKKYIDMDDLKEDDDKEIFFDKKYDTTYYDIIDEYQTQQKNMSPEDFKEFLTEKLQESMGLNKEDSLYEATSIIDKKRRVKQGHYAVIEHDDDDGIITNKYYERNGMKWIENKSFENSGDQSNMFCNVQEKCFQIKNTCETNDVAEISMKNDLVNDITNEFGEKFSLNKEQYNQEISFELKNAMSMLKKLVVVHENQLYKYNNSHYYYSLDVDENSGDAKSPNTGLYKQIMGITDFVKRQTCLIEFINKKTREPIIDNGENQFWLYCIESNLKIMPSFLKRLAIAFINKQDYTLEQDLICKERGTISDDNKAWVDKYSGEIIKLIEMSSEEGYDEQGFRLQSREIIEMKIGDQVNNIYNEELTQNDPKAIVVNNIVNTIGKYLGYNLENGKEFIIQNSLIALDEVVPNEEKYIQDAIIYEGKKGKKLPSYREHFNQNLLLLCLANIVIYVQTAIPAIQTKKTHPGCKKSFSGYPLDGVEDLTGITYIACIANKIKSSIEPWSSIQKMKEPSIVNKLKVLLENVLMEKTMIQQRYSEKRNYLLQTSDNLIPIDLDIRLWSQFLPPLIKIEMKSVEPPPSGFDKSLLGELKKGTKKGNNMIETLKSKIVSYSLEINQSIQDIVEKEKPILNSLDPYTQNSCCARNPMVQTLQYFIDKDPSIERDNILIRKTAILLDDIKRFEDASLIVDPYDTKRKYPILNANFADYVKYIAIMNFCNFNTLVPLSDDLVKMCLVKPDDYDKNESMEEKIRKMERDNIVISDEMFYNILNVINNDHILHLHLSNPVVSNIEKMRMDLSLLSEKQSSFISQTGIDLLTDMLDDFDVSQDGEQKGRELRNYLSKINQAIIENVMHFLTNKTKNTTKTQLTNIQKFLLELMDFKQDGEGLLLNQEDETLHRSIGFVENAIYMLINVFTNMIVNEKDASNVKIPKYWKLSDRHNKDIKAFVEDYYKFLKPYYQDPMMKSIFTKINNNIGSYINLIKHTPFYGKINIGGREIDSSLNNKTCKLLFHYYFLSIIYNLLQETDRKHQKHLIRDLSLDITQLQGIGTDISVQSEITGEITELDEILGQEFSVQEKMSSFIVDIMNHLIKGKSIVNISMESIKESNLRSRDKEKDGKTQKLQDLSIEEREIENLFKNHKLEKWNMGLQKGLVQYTKGTYDDERNEMEEIAIKEKRLGKKDYVTDMNKDIYMLEMESDDIISNEIENDEFSMSGIPDDDDAGDIDDAYMHSHDEDLE